MFLISSYPKDFWADNAHALPENPFIMAFFLERGWFDLSLTLMFVCVFLQ
jgi:hypothetical protein